MSDEIKNENEFNEFEDTLELEFGEDENKDETITKTCIVYKIFCKIEESVPMYIGSTIQKLGDRLREHKSRYKKRREEYSVYRYFDKYGFENFKIEALEQVEITGSQSEILKQTRMFEQKWMDKFRNENIEICNKLSAYITEEQLKEYHKQYREENKERILNYVESNREKIAKRKKEYYETNKEEILKYQREYREKNIYNLTKYKREYYETNKEEILKYQREYLEANREKIANRMKAYREKNKEEIAKRKKEYREKNKEEIAKKANQKFECECGGRYVFNHKSTHQKTKKHQDYLQTLNPPTPIPISHPL